MKEPGTYVWQEYRIFKKWDEVLTLIALAPKQVRFRTYKKEFISEMNGRG
jgi:hypothetical protein